MVGIPGVAWVAAIVAGLIAIAMLVLLLLRSRRINLLGDPSSGEKPAWMESTPPSETMAATQADGEGIRVYDYDPGEQVAAPFAEQIEDILRHRLQSDSTLAGMTVDLGTTPEGGLEIWVNGERYTDISQLPNRRLREAFEQAVARWEQSQS